MNNYHLNPFYQPVENKQANDLVALGYISRSTHDLGILGLVNLCVQSYCNNTELGLTGILFFDGQHFGQVLEGSRDIVNERWQVIQRDQRHEALHVIAHKDIAQRSFSDWTFHVLDADTIVMLFPELGGMVRMLHFMCDGSDVSRVMDAYPAPAREQRMMRYRMPIIH